MANAPSPSPSAVPPRVSSDLHGVDMPPQAAWTVRLLGAIEVRGPAGQLSRWPTRSVALLLARLALAPDRVHPREELIDMLWPGVALEVGRNRLRQALSTLKSLLEPGTSPAVISADRQAVRAVPGALACDARSFEQALRAGDWAQAEALYRGELMPGFYDEWVLEERARLVALADRLQAMPRLPSPPPSPASRASPAAAPGQLPAYWTRLFGTEINATRLRELARHQRLVTVLGAGGSGKTRLAVEASRALLESAAWVPQGGGPAPAFAQALFVSLIDCNTEQRAVDALAAALQASGKDPLKAIAQVLAGQHTLLVLDNYEQLVGQADTLVQRLLTDTPSLHLLITSRQRLGLPGEHVFELAGLPVPQSAVEGQPRPVDETHAGNAAVALFVDRARAAAPDFSMAPPHDAAVDDLVRLLSGMPLAIELAASRMRGLTPQALLGLLTEGGTPMLDLLARDGAPAGMAQRHASLRHVVAWSWQQLTPPLMLLMQALSVFAEPAGVGMVAAVAGLDARLARERLEQLRDHSLVVARKDDQGTPRYALLQPVREFVVERADAHRLAQMRERMRDWLIGFARQCAARGHQAIAEVEQEMPHVQAAIQDAATDGPQASQQALELAVALRRHWEIDTRAGAPAVIMQATQAALPFARDPEQRAEACVLLAYSHVMAGTVTEALALAEQAMAATRPQVLAHALMRKVQAQLFSASDQSGVDGPLAEALKLAEDAGDLEAQALIVRMQFLVAVNRDGDRAGGEKLATRVQQLWERLGHRRNAYSGLMDRASCWIHLGRLDEAATALAACENVARQERYATGYIMSSWQLGSVLLALRRYDAALAAYRRCLQGAWDHKRLAYAADALVLLPGGLAFSGQPGKAARLLGFAVPHWQRQFGSFYNDLERDVRRTRRWLRHRLGAAQLEALRLEGACMTLAEAVNLGLSRAGE